MNYTENFQDFANRVSTTDLALYAGAGLILWVLFSDKLGPIKEYVVKLFSGLQKNRETNGSLPVVALKPKKGNNPDFLDLVSSWKHTRDLAESLGCKDAVKIVDQMFPLLVPSACSKDVENENK